MTTQKKTIAAAVADSEPWDFDTWLDEGSRPQRHATLYAKNRLQADIVDLERQLEEYHAEDADLHADTERLAELEAELDRLTGSDRMVGGVDAIRKEIRTLQDRVKGREKSTHAAKLEAQIKRLQHELADSGVRFTLQAMTEDEQSRIDERYPAPKRPKPIRPDVTGDDITDMEAKAAADDANAAADEAHTEALTQVYRERYFEYMALQIIEPRQFTVDELRRIQERLGEAEFTKLFAAGQEASAAMSASTPTWRGNSGGAQGS